MPAVFQPAYFCCTFTAGTNEADITFQQQPPRLKNQWKHDICFLSLSYIQYVIRRARLQSVIILQIVRIFF